LEKYSKGVGFSHCEYTNKVTNKLSDDLKQLLTSSDNLLGKTSLKTTTNLSWE